MYLKITQLQSIFIPIHNSAPINVPTLIIQPHSVLISVTSPGDLYTGNFIKFRTLFSLCSNKMFVIRAEILKILVRKANRGEPDQTAFQKQSDLDLPCLSRPFFGRRLAFGILEHVHYNSTWNFEAFFNQTRSMSYCESQLGQA